ncbi:MAG: cytochrome c biogenesis protein CcsA [Rhodospirillales bacterium]|nr:cytochrome c biogenesis protein CcsA [Rhodospirillales bacterium]MBO6786829.1 cytochrome c biogenesis protein CcsA [Rhodospirillales bacterium]
MQTGLLFGLTAIASLVPAVALTWRTHFARNTAFWTVCALACIGPASAVAVRSQDAWQADFSTSIWVTIAATMALFLVFSVLVRSVWRLAPLLSGYMLVLAVLGFAWQHAPNEPVSGATTGLLVLHIAFAVTTYGLATLAAVAAWAAFLQERALKRKDRPTLGGVLPSITDCDRLVLRFLLVGEIVLGLGLVSGVVLNAIAGGALLTPDHKTIFTLAAFAVIGLLLFAQAKYGLRGRKAARVVLLAYLMLTLGYPGVKFVTDVLLG